MSGARPGEVVETAETVEVTVLLPSQLSDLAGIDRRVPVRLGGEPTVARLLDALEERLPALRGTIRDQRTGARRAYVRYFSCGRDVSDEPADSPLDADVLAGREVFRVLGAISGG